MGGAVKAITNTLGLTSAKVKTPQVPDPIDDNEDQKAKDEVDARRRRRGFAANLVTGPQGAGTPQTAARKLLGAG